MSQFNSPSPTPITPPPTPIAAITPPPTPIAAISPPPAPILQPHAPIAAIPPPPALIAPDPATHAIPFFLNATHPSQIATPPYSWDLGSESVEMVPKTVFASMVTEDDEFPCSDSPMTTPFHEKLVTESEYDRWRANGGLFPDEQESPLLAEVEAVRFPKYEYSKTKPTRR